MLHCSFCCKPLGRQAIVGECGHAFCSKNGVREDCASTCRVRGRQVLTCPVCNCARAAWGVGEDFEGMPSVLRDLVYANISLPITGISGVSVKKEIEIFLVSCCFRVFILRHARPAFLSRREGAE